MLKVLALVEGQTEEAFVKRLLAPALVPRQVSLVPVILATKRLLTGDKHRGGYVPYARLRSELVRLLRDPSAVRVTTMLDYYGLPPGFPGRESPQGNTSRERAHLVESAWAAEIQHPRFLPHLSLHEFEGLLFSAPDEMARSMDRPGLASSFSRIRDDFRTPEDINDHESTAPSRRIRNLFPEYSKPFHGELIAERIGIARIRAECHHFSDWLRALESLGA